MDADVVLLHGFTQTGRSWDPVAKSLGTDWQVHRPDIGGHGRTPAIAPLSFAGEAALLDAVAPRRFVLAGYSMGGRLALYYALHRPERVRALVLVSASPGLRDAEDRAARRRSDAELAESLESRPFEDWVSDWERQPLFADQPGHVAAAAHADRLRNTADGLAAALRGLGTGTMPSLWHRLGELAMPVVLIVGERDAKFRAIAASMRRELPEAEMVVVPGAGHALPLEAPGAIADEIRRFAPNRRRD